MLNSTTKHILPSRTLTTLTFLIRDTRDWRKCVLSVSLIILWDCSMCFFLSVQPWSADILVSLATFLCQKPKELNSIFVSSPWTFPEPVIISLFSLNRDENTWTADTDTKLMAVFYLHTGGNLVLPEGSPSCKLFIHIKVSVRMLSLFVELCLPAKWLSSRKLSIKDKWRSRM